MKRVVLFVNIVFILLSCKSSDPNFEFKSLDLFKDEIGDIKEGTIIQILSFSGGPECTGKTTYFYQFIGIIKGSNDTVRILSPCQQIPEGTQPNEGSFSSWEKTSEIINKALIDHGQDKFEADDNKVIFNKKQGDIELRNYKTVIGTLGF